MICSSFGYYSLGRFGTGTKGEKRTSLSHLIVLPLCKILTFSWFTWTGKLRSSVVSICMSSQHLGGIPKAVMDVGDPVQKDLIHLNIPAACTWVCSFSSLLSCMENGKLTQTRPLCLSSLSPRTEVVSCPNGCDFFLMSLFSLIQMGTG